MMIINLSKFSNETSEKHNEPKTYFKWKNEQNNELYCLRAYINIILSKILLKCFMQVMSIQC